MATAAQDLNEKLKLEAQLRPKIESFQKKQARKLIRSFAQQSVVPNFSEDDAELAEILLQHYNDVGDVFSNRVDLPDDVTMTEEEAAAIAAALAAYYATLSNVHAGEINRTTQDDAYQAVNIAEMDQENDPMISKFEVAAIAGAVFARKLRSRLTAIVATETNGPAEAAKATEAEVLLGVAPSVTGGSAERPPIEKEWETVGDDKVRPDHVQADGQRRNMNSPFDVGGEQLRWPGDSALGASVGNIINCRCSAGYDEQGIIQNRREQEQRS